MNNLLNLGVQDWRQKSIRIADFNRKKPYITDFLSGKNGNSSTRKVVTSEPNEFQLEHLAVETRNEIKHTQKFWEDFNPQSISRDSQYIPFSKRATSFFGGHLNENRWLINNVLDEESP